MDLCAEVKQNAKRNQELLANFHKSKQGWAEQQAKNTQEDQESLRFLGDYKAEYTETKKLPVYTRQLSIL